MLREYRTLLVGSLLALLLTTLGLAFLAWRGAFEAIAAIQRTQSTHQVLEALLRIRVDTNRMLTDLTVVALAGEKAGLTEWQAEERIRADIASVRAGIAREVANLEAREDRAREAVELQQLRRVEAAIEALVREFDAVSRLLASGQRTQATQRIVSAVDKEGEGGGLARNFRSAIQAAIDHEEQVVRLADAHAVATLTRSARATQTAALAALFITAVGLALLLRRLSRPLQRLSTAASAVARGDVSTRVAVEGGDEFARVARGINGMLDELEAGRKALESARSELEATVAERTAELSEANEALRASDAVRRRFLADISHELRTPLTIIRGEAEVALRASGTAVRDHRDTLVRIVQQADHTAQLVNDLLFIARTDADRLRLNEQPTRIDELAQAVCIDARALGDGKHVSVEYVGPAGPAVVRGDPVRLRQLLHILLDNAVRYSDTDGRALVAVERGTQVVVLRVADHGRGIDAAEVPHVFERFYRGANAADREGSGLGLTMAKAIVEAHRGTIELTSRLAHGTVVTVSLPIHAEEAQGDAADKVVVAEVAGRDVGPQEF